MGSSSEYAAKVKEFKTIKSNVSTILSPLEKCKNITTDSANYTEKIIISGKGFDKDELKGFDSNLNIVYKNITAIMSECDEKIAKYQALYEQALARERAEEEAKKRKNINN